MGSINKLPYDNCEIKHNMATLITNRYVTSLSHQYNIHTDLVIIRSLENS